MPRVGGDGLLQVLADVGAAALGVADEHGVFDVGGGVAGAQFDGAGEVAASGLVVATLEGERREAGGGGGRVGIVAGERLIETLGKFRPAGEKGDLRRRDLAFGTGEPFGLGLLGRGRRV